MKERKNKPSQVSTCFEGSPCAEMMRKITNGHGIGSLCEEMMRSLMDRYQKGQEGPRAAKNDKGLERDEKSNRTED